MMKYLSHVSSVAMAVAIAMKEGLEFAIQRGSNRIVAESDSLETIEACKGDHVWHNDSSAIFGRLYRQDGGDW
jgi:hypothetical protein